VHLRAAHGHLLSAFWDDKRSHNERIRSGALRTRVERRKTGRPVRHAESDGAFETEKELREEGRRKAEESQKSAEASRGGGKQVEESKAGGTEVETVSGRAESKEGRYRDETGRSKRDESEFNSGARGGKRGAAENKASNTEGRIISNGRENEEERPRDVKDHKAKTSDEKKEEGREIRRVKYEKSKASSKLQKQARRPVGPPLAPSIRQRNTLREPRVRSPSTSSGSHVGGSAHKAKAKEMRSRGASKTGELTPSLGDKEGIEPTPKGEAAEPVEIQSRQLVMVEPMEGQGLVVLEKQSWQLAMVEPMEGQGLVVLENQSRQLALVEPMEGQGLVVLENQSRQLAMVEPVEGQGLVLHVKSPASLALQEEPQSFALVTETRAESTGKKKAEGTTILQTEGVWEAPQKDAEQEVQKTGQGEPPTELADRLVLSWEGRTSVEYRAVQSAFMPSLQEPFPGIKELMEEVDMEVRESKALETETEQVSFNVHQDNAAESRERGSAYKYSPEEKNLSGERNEKAAEEKENESKRAGPGKGVTPARDEQVLDRGRNGISSVGDFEKTHKEETVRGSVSGGNANEFGHTREGRETGEESEKGFGVAKEVTALGPAIPEITDANTQKTRDLESAEAEDSKMQQEGLVSQLRDANLGKAWQEVVQSEIDGEESLALENGVLHLEAQAGGEDAWSGEENFGRGSSGNEQTNPENEDLKETDMKTDLGTDVESSRGNEASRRKAAAGETDSPKGAWHSGFSGGGLQDERTEESKSAYLEESKSAHMEERKSAPVEESTESNLEYLEGEKTAEGRKKQGKPSAGGKVLPRDSVTSAVQTNEAPPQETFEHSERARELLESLIGGLYSPPIVWPPKDVPENAVALMRSASRETALVKTVPQPGSLPAVREGLSEGLESKRAEGEGLAVKRTQGEGFAGLDSQNGPVTQMAGGQIAEEEIQKKGTGSDQAQNGPVSQLMESLGGTEHVTGGEEKKEKEEKEAPPESLAGRAVIKIVGVGGGGCNAVDHMVQVKNIDRDSRL
jgi:hypothetical protein